MMRLLVYSVVILLASTAPASAQEAMQTLLGTRTKQFVIVARNCSTQNQYIQRALLDGKPLDKPWFYHRELVDGGALELELGPKPNRRWGRRPEDAPPSMGREM